MRREQPTGLLIDERSLLFQAKSTPRYNRLTSDGSTKLERRLLEQIDRKKPLCLHRDTSRKSAIGSYVLGQSQTLALVGLQDCARYVLAPKGGRWARTIPYTYPPYQVGWPSSYPRPELRKPRGLVDTVLAMGLHGTLGRLVFSPAADPWSQLVADLRGNYVAPFMMSYGHPRIQRVSAFLLSEDWLLQASSTMGAPPNLLEAFAEREPALPVLTRTLRSVETVVDVPIA